jgi:hypothetical protein
VINMKRKEPLYRKENKVSLQTKYYVRTGGEFRYQRNTKKFLNDESTHAPMNSGKYGYDYAPLFKFLLSKVGKNWDEIYSEAKSRLDKEEPIWYLVATCDNDKRETVCVGEHTHYSGLYIDENNLLQKVNPNANPSVPICSMHTHSFNGKAYT